MTPSEVGKAIANELLRADEHYQGGKLGIFEGICIITSETYKSISRAERAGFARAMNLRLGQLDCLGGSEGIIKFNDTHELWQIIELLRSL